MENRTEELKYKFENDLQDFKESAAQTYNHMLFYHSIMEYYEKPKKLPKKHIQHFYIMVENLRCEINLGLVNFLDDDKNLIEFFEWVKSESESLFGISNKDVAIKYIDKISKRFESYSSSILDLKNLRNSVTSNFDLDTAKFVYEKGFAFIKENHTEIDVSINSIYTIHECLYDLHDYYCEINEKEKLTYFKEGLTGDLIIASEFDRMMSKLDNSIKCKNNYLKDIMKGLIEKR